MAKRLALATLTAAMLAAPAQGSETLYQQGTLIIPMDTTHQDRGALAAYGLVYELLRSGVPVEWAIAPGKSYGAADFTASAVDLASGLPVVAHGYRGGPFLVDAARREEALPVVVAWRRTNPEVAVHEASGTFTATVARRLLAPPSIAVFADGDEDTAFDYLNAARIPMSNGEPWPAKRDGSGLYTCPGTSCCPDCLDASEASGPTTSSHTDGALFDADGEPRYCQFVAVQNGAHAGLPEVVAEVREFLASPVHFFAGCHAVHAFENDVNGRFLTSGGLRAAGLPSAIAHHHDDDPFAQADGPFASPGGSLPSFGLAPGSSYHDANAVMVSGSAAPLGSQDVWMSGRVDADPLRGKVSYLGGHRYQTALPLSRNARTQGTRYFLNALFEAPCAAGEGAPSPWIELSGPSATSSGTYAFSACHGNTGDGPAFDAVLTVTLPDGGTLVGASPAGSASGDELVWSLATLPAASGACVSVTVSLDAVGTHAFDAALVYEVGVRTDRLSAPTLSVRYGTVNLLRYGAPSAAPISPPYDSIFLPRGSATSLDPSRDLEVAAFSSGGAFPHAASDLGAAAPAIVFHEAEGASGDTLRVAKSGDSIVVTY